MSKSTKTFQQQLEELEAIIEWFDSEDVDIDEAVTKFEQGTKLINDLKKHLSEVENKVTEVKNKSTTSKD
ncbi:MAG: exodeoxyribonuclease VII small subunit [Candidatus Saccharimonadales bacterium]